MKMIHLLFTIQIADNQNNIFFVMGIAQISNQNSNTNAVPAVVTPLTINLAFFSDAAQIAVWLEFIIPMHEENVYVSLCITTSRQWREIIAMLYCYAI